MSITAIVTNHNYGEYLVECLDSAAKFCDQIFVYDDGSTDESVDIVKAFGVDRFVHKRKASGGPVVGSNWGIRNTYTSHLIFLDSDNYLVSKPPENKEDYTFADLEIVSGGVWRYADRPTDPIECLYYYVENNAIPIPWGGVWRTAFLKGNHLSWRYWPRTKSAPDFRTAIDWLQASPTITYQDEPFLAFRIHDGQLTDVERDIFEEEACRLAPSIGAILRSRGYGG